MGKLAFALGIAVTKLVSIRNAAGDELAAGAAARRASAGDWMNVWIDAAGVSWAPPVFRPTLPLYLRIPLSLARARAWGASRHPSSCRLPSEEPLAVQLFPADGVTWVVSLPTGLAGDTIWPDMEWIEALAPVPGEAEAGATTETLEEVCAA